MSDLTLTMPAEQARAIVANELLGDNANAGKASIAAALVMHEHESRRSKLGLPWVAHPDVDMQREPPTTDDTVWLSGLRTHVKVPNTHIADLMATAPDLAEALEALIAVVSVSTGGEAFASDHTVTADARKALRDAGWL